MSPPYFRPAEGTYARRLADLDVPVAYWSRPISAAIWIVSGGSVDDLRRAADLARHVGSIVPAKWPTRRSAGTPPLTDESEAETPDRWKRTFNTLLAVARALVLRAIDGDLKASAELARRLEGGIAIPFDSSTPFGASGLIDPDAPVRWRYRPVSAAIWRALMLTTAELEVRRTSGPAATLDALAAQLVLKAVAGDLAACAFVMNRIDGPVRSKAGRTSDASPRDAGDEADRERTIAGLVMAYEQALAATARG